jgi:peptidoglycan hydrolase-like protein with peptidoglycan-binding domain
MRALTFKVGITSCLLLGAAACREDKREERREATRRPVKLDMDPDELLKPQAVVKLQQALATAGFKRDWVAGKLDEETTAALRKLQQEKKLPATGVPDEKTAAALGLSASEIFVHGVDPKGGRPRDRT